jgi:uncharacterized protein
MPDSAASFYKLVTCPACQGESVYSPANPYRPFCGERCKNIDLGAWANEEFRVNAKPDLDPDADFLDDQPPSPPLPH